MAQYLMLLWENPASFADASPSDIQKLIQEYVAWRQRIVADGTYRASAKLKDEGGKHIRGGPKPTIADGPYTESNELIGGYFQIEAANYEAAATIAKSCPHVKYGWIELREIEPT